MYFLKNFSVVILASLLLLTTLPAKAETNSELQRDQVFQFLKDHVVGKKLVLTNNPCENTISGTDISCEFSRSTIYSNLEQTEKGLKFNMIYDIKQTNKIPQSDNTIVTENKDRILVTACELSASKTENAPAALFGYCHSLANSIGDIAGNVSAISIKTDGNILLEHRATVNFSDCFANNATGYRMCTSENNIELTMKNDKLERETTAFSFNIINPTTGEKMSLGDPTTYLDIEM